MKMKSLYTRFLAIIAVVVLLGVGGAIWNGLLVKRSASERLGEVMQKELEAIWGYILNSEQEVMVNGTSTLTRNRDALKALRKGDRQALAEAALPTYKRMAASGSIDRFRVLDADGNVMLSAPDRFSGSLDGALVREALREQKVVRGIMANGGKPEITIVFPLYARGRMIGAGVFSRGMESALAALKRSASVEAFLVGPDGRLLQSTAPELAARLPLAASSGAPPTSEIQVDDVDYFLTRLAQSRAGEEPWGWLISVRDDTAAIASQRFWERVTIGVLIMGGLFTLLFVGWFLGRACRSLSSVVGVMQRISQGDLTVEVDIDRDDEIGQLEQSARTMVERLRSLLERVNRSAEGLVDVSARMASSTERTLSEMENQQNQTQLVATSVDQMVVSIREVASSAEATASAARQADEDTNHGLEVIGTTVKNIGTLAEEVQSAAEQTVHLEKDAEAIGSVLDVIGSIAEQTNLLALNAAIEAARAGEQGRGFAVVADEVRTLAGRTQEATLEIQQMIEALQRRVSVVVDAMEQGQLTAGNGVENASGSGELLDNIHHRVSDIAGMITQIASAAEEQSTVAGEINHSITAIKEVAEHTTDSARQNREVNQSVSRMAEELQQVMSQFRVGRG